jgi:hypothetical protein
MPETGGDAPVGGVSRADIARLASSYDRFVGFFGDHIKAETERVRSLPAAGESPDFPVNQVFAISVTCPDC